MKENLKLMIIVVLGVIVAMQISKRVPMLNSFDGEEII